MTASKPPSRSCGRGCRHLAVMALITLIVMLFTKFSK